MSKNPFAPPDPNAPPPQEQAPAPSAPDSAQGEDGPGAPQGKTPQGKTPGGKTPETPQGKNPNPTSSPGSGPGFTPPSMEQLKEASGSTFRFGATLVLALLASQLPLPYTLAAPVVITVAVVLGIMALRRSWAISPRNLMTPMLVAGIAMALMMSVTVASKFALWPIEMERQECTTYAITNTAKAECEAQYHKAVSDRLDSLRGGS